MKRLNLFELPKHIALIALGQDWMTQDHTAELISACELGMDLGKSDPAVFDLAHNGLQMLLRHVDPNDMTIKHIANLEEMRHVIGSVVQWIAHQPNRAVHDAVIKRLRELNEPKRIS